MGIKRIPLRKGMTREYVEAALVKAAAAGHVLQEDLERTKLSRTQYGGAMRCSCGWRSEPDRKPMRAFVAGFVHIGQVIGEDVIQPPDTWGVGASPDRPERLDDATKEPREGGEGEPSSTACGATTLGRGSAAIAPL